MTDKKEEIIEEVLNEVLDKEEEFIPEIEKEIVRISREAIKLSIQKRDEEVLRLIDNELKNIDFTMDKVNNFDYSDEEEYLRQEHFNQLVGRREQLIELKQKIKEIKWNVSVEQKWKKDFMNGFVGDVVIELRKSIKLKIIGFMQHKKKEIYNQNGKKIKW